MNTQKKTTAFVADAGVTQPRFGHTLLADTLPAFAIELERRVVQGSMACIELLGDEDGRPKLLAVLP